MAQVRYIVNDVPRSIVFYTEMLGFSLEQQFGPAMAILCLDDLRLWLAGPTASKAMPDGTKPAPGGWCRFVVTISDLDSQVAEMKSKGVHFRNEIIEGPGGRQILCEDPSGNVVELFQPALPSV